MNVLANSANKALVSEPQAFCYFVYKILSFSVQWKLESFMINHTGVKVLEFSFVPENSDV